MIRGGFLALAALLALAGCGTVTSLARGPDAVPYGGWPVYGGVRSALLEPSAVYGSEYWKIGIDGLISAALDTALLPATLPWALLR